MNTTPQTATTDTARILDLACIAGYEARAIADIKRAARTRGRFGANLSRIDTPEAELERIALGETAPDRHDPQCECRECKCRHEARAALAADRD